MTEDNLCSPNLLSLEFMIKTQTVMNLIDNIILFRYENQEIKLPPKIQKKKEIPETEIKYIGMYHKKY